MTATSQIQCSFCDNNAVCFRVYLQTGLVHACDSCAVMLDDEVQQYGVPISIGDTYAQSVDN